MMPGTLTYEYKIPDKSGKGVTTLRIVKRGGEDVYIEVVREVETTTRTGITIADSTVINEIRSVLE